jgi:hypothetical protein
MNIAALASSSISPKISIHVNDLHPRQTENHEAGTHRSKKGRFLHSFEAAKQTRIGVILFRRKRGNQTFRREIKEIHPLNATLMTFEVIVEAAENFPARDARSEQIDDDL